MERKNYKKLRIEQRTIDHKRISIDFDTVIHKYSKGLSDGSIYDEPVENAIEGLKRLSKAGFEVIVFTSKTVFGEKRNREIKRWLKKYGLDLKVTSIKLPSLAYIDNRAIRFTNWKDIVSYFI